MELSVDLCDFVDRTAELFGVHNECGNDADRDQAVDGEVAAKSRDDYEPDVADAVHEGTHDAAADFGADAGFCQFIGYSTEAFGGMFLFIVSDYGTVPVDDFFHRSVHAAQ